MRNLDNHSNRRFEVKKIVDLTPMIDVIFLLVIFFMTSSTLIQVNSLKIDLPEAATSDKEISKPSVFSINEAGGYFIDGKQVSESDVERVLQEIAAKKDLKVLLVEGYKNLPYQKIIEVMSLAKKVGIEKVSLSVKSSN